MRILVTGGCGYIGSALVPRLRENEAVSEVVVLDSLAAGSPRALLGAIGDDLEFRRGDVRDYEAVESAMGGVDRVIHLASITGAESTHDRREETRAVIVGGTENVVTAASEAGVESVVYASSCNSYGYAADTNIDETTTTAPCNPYGEAKVEAERAVRDAADASDFSATSLRMSTNYGYAPGIRFNLVVNHFVFRGLTGRPLTVYGDGENWRPFIHVRDAARAYEHAAVSPEQWPRDVYNVGSTDQNYRIEDVARVVSEELGRDLEIAYLEDERPGPSYHVEFDRLSETGFEPSWTLRSGVRELADRFAQSRDTAGTLDASRPNSPSQEVNVDGHR
ncbi:NAD-dependent epimerase/dehydratase family protein [Natrinema amylolyticum]|uniref:NAD-dependent epimerase/dehydratase family protein n=1 Tax=Natrinema amylolyticum TaxID=2878679 RepID=UPI001CFAA9E9|nr:NAD(P)-dependent oxidoreductase [Natrinema amylolyticum]